MAHLKATYKDIFKIALPLILGNVAWTCNGLFDTIFVGNLGKVELDAIGFASVFYSVFFMMGFSFTRGTQLLIARRMGELNRGEVGNIMDNTIIALTGVAVLLFAVVKFNLHAILSTLLTNTEIVARCEEFLNYRMWGLVPSFITFVFIAFYSGIGQTVILSMSVALMTLLNVTLNYGLVYGKFGLPEVGIGGSGLATAIAETVAVAVLVGGTFYKGRAFEFKMFKFKRIDASLLKQMTKISVPLMLQSLAAVGGWLVFFSKIETKLGADQLAVSTIYRQLIMVFTIPTWSLGSTANTIISNLVGQRDTVEIKKAVRKISLVSLCFAVVSCGIIAMAPHFCIGIFVSKYDNATLVPMAVQGLPVIFVGFLIMSFGNILFNSVISVGDIFVALGIEIVVVIIYIAYFMFILSQPWASLNWVWTAEWVYWLLMFFGSLAFFRLKHLEVV